MRIDEKNGEKNCAWFEDVDGRLVVAEIQLEDKDIRLVITDSGFDLVPTPITYAVMKVFISYSSKDQKFANRLYTDLQSKGVRCWLASEDLKIGDKIRVGMDEAIRRHDKLLLVLSMYSVANDWVEQEVETALERERKEKRTVLFPIR